MCGGAPFRGRLLMRHQGLSPRVRGSRAGELRRRANPGIIPACAGEPRQGDWRPAALEDYPRVCGGAAYIPVMYQSGKGLSPRVRGSRVGGIGGGEIVGIIPACAGEPCWTCAGTGRAWDYPRVCGGAIRQAIVLMTRKGLSPRVRGSPASRKHTRAIWGIIPACAGEPASETMYSAHTRDYPRVCGGAGQVIFKPRTRKGLSPRVRGSRSMFDNARSSAGIIPACAGEPSSGLMARLATRDYPRVCGGAVSASSFRTSAQGLSPRVRGSPSAPRRRTRGRRIIPACAGEPRPCRARPGSVWDYPRVCGGAQLWRSSRRVWRGLSPRVRGSRKTGAGRGRRQGIIPACAGEPCCG